MIESNVKKVIYELALLFLKQGSWSEGVVRCILKNSGSGLCVQWLGYMALTHEIRVQLPAREP